MEALLPQRIAEHDHLLFLIVFLLGEVAAQHGGDTQGGEYAAAHA